MSKPPVIVFGDFTLDEATRFQQLNLGPRPEYNRTPDQHQGDGPPPVRFGSVDPTVHISHSPPALPQPAPALPPYPHHPPPYLTANHHPPFLQSLPPPHFAPPRSYYPPAPYYNSFGTFPHPGGGPLPFNPDYLYARPILPPHPYHGPVDPSQTLGLSSAPLAVMPPLSTAWRPHPLASPPPAQPDRAPHPPPGLPEFPPGPPPPWAPPSLHLPAAGAPFHHERPHSSGGGHVPVTTEESAPSGEEPLVSSGKAESRDAEDSTIPPKGEPAHAVGRERTHEEAENATAADPPGSQSQEPALIPGHASGGGPAEEAEAEAAPTGWGPEPSSANEANVLSESPTEATEDAAPAGSGGEQVSTSETEQQPGLGAARPKSWAALVGKQAGQGFVPQRPVVASSSRTAYNGPGTQPRGVVGSKGGEKPQLSGPAWIRLLKEAPPVRLRPRGLMNTGNSCFLNSTLQALFACPPFLLLVNQLKTSPIDPNEYPMLWALVNYLAQFDVLPPSPAPAPVRPGPTGGSPLVDLGLPFSPDMFVDVLNRFSPNNQHRGLRRARQEDAQEFLSYVMDRMHEELLKLETSPVEAPPARAGNGPLANGAAGGAGEGDDEWETVGPKNKSAVTRMHTHSESALSSIFGGSLQSLVKTKGTKASAMVQPFTIVQLDISAEAVKSVEDALQQFAAPETLDGYRTKGKTEVAASKLLKIQTLPRVLVLHLMRFSFSGERGSTKVHKPVKFPPTLTIPVKLLASPPAPGEIRRYELVATVSHIGKDPSGGHYTADARQEDGRWLRFDDSNVSVVALNRVLHDQAYLLLYKRVVQ